MLLTKTVCAKKSVEGMTNRTVYIVAFDTGFMRPVVIEQESIIPFSIQGCVVCFVTEIQRLETHRSEISKGRKGEEEVRKVPDVSSLTDNASSLTGSRLQCGGEDLGSEINPLSPKASGYRKKQKSASVTSRWYLSKCQINAGMVVYTHQNSLALLSEKH